MGLDVSPNESERYGSIRRLINIVFLAINVFPNHYWEVEESQMKRERARITFLQWLSDNLQKTLVDIFSHKNGIHL